MYYEINVVRHGKHFFATAKRSLTDLATANKVAKALMNAFPEAEGYEISMSRWEESGHPVPLPDPEPAKFRIFPDQDPTNPRDWDNLGTMACSHPNYNLGDEQFDDPIEWLIEMTNSDEEEVYDLCEKELDNDYNKLLKHLEEEFSKNYFWLPLYLYEHSGITMSTSAFNCRWDSGQVGYIYIAKDSPEVVSEEQVLEYMRNEVKTYDQYLTGDVYGFALEDEYGNQLDSCHGFYGSDPFENGMTDHIKEKYHHLLEGAEVEYR